MKAWSLFLPQVAKETYGAPEILQIEHIRNAAIEFCERTFVWQVTQDPYPLMPRILNAPVTEDFQVDPGSLVHKILRASLQTTGAQGGQKVTPRTPDWCDDNYPGWDTGGQLGRPTNVTQVSPDQFIPVPANNGTWAMVLRVALKPTRDSTQGPDVLYNDYLEAIASGAKGRLMLEKGNAWSDPSMGAAHIGAFNEAVSKTYERVLRGYGRGAIRTRASFV